MPHYRKIGLALSALGLAACQSTVPPDADAIAPVVAMPDWAVLAARAAAAPTPEQLAEEAAYRREQARLLAADLRHPDAGRRLLTVERIGAYPGLEAEAALLKALRRDKDSRVRQMAARVLGDTAVASKPVAQGLAAVARPPASPELQQAALFALEQLFLRSPEPAQQRLLQQSLRRIARTPHLPPRQRAYLQDLLERFGR